MTKPAATMDLWETTGSATKILVPQPIRNECGSKDIPNDSVCGNGRVGIYGVHVDHVRQALQIDDLDACADGDAG